jgi:hypothetical protein
MRHRADEFDARVLLLMLALKLESESILDKLLQLDRVCPEPPSVSSHQEFPSWLASVLATPEKTYERGSSTHALCEAICAYNADPQGRRSLRYAHDILYDPPSLTLQEVDRLLREEDATTEVDWHHILDDMAGLHGADRQDIGYTLLDAILYLYEFALYQCSASVFVEDLNTYAASAASHLQTFKQLFVAQARDGSVAEKTTERMFSLLLDTLTRWRGYTHNEKDLWLREEEAGVVRSLGEIVTTPFMVSRLDSLLAADVPGGGGGGRPRFELELIDVVGKRIVREFESHVMDGQARGALRSPSLATRWTLLGYHAGVAEELEEILATAMQGGDSESVLLGFEFLDALRRAREGGLQQQYGDPPILGRKEVMLKLWLRGTSREMQHLKHFQIREIHRMLNEAGIAAALPAWAVIQPSDDLAGDDDL